MRYKSGIVMKRLVKFLGLALLFLFSARFVHSQSMPMPEGMPDQTPSMPEPVATDVTVPAPQPAPIAQIAATAPAVQPAPVAPAVATAPSVQPYPVTQLASATPAASTSGIPEQIVEPNNFLPTNAPSNANILPSSAAPTTSVGSAINATPAINTLFETAKEEKDIYLNFDNADLSNFVNYIAELRQMNLVVDKSIESVKISLTIREPLSVDGAWNVFLTVLEMGGFSIIKIPGDLDKEPLLFKVIPKDQKTTQPLPAYINVSPDTLPDNDINIRYVMFLTNMNVGDLEELLKSMLSDKGMEVPVKDVNGFVITDKSLNIKAAAKVLLELDQMGTAEAVTVIKLKTANAKDVKDLLDGLIKQPEISPLARLLGKTAEGTTSYFPPGTKVIAEERTNALILLGSPKVIKKIEEFVVDHIDIELQQAKSPLHVYELQYTDATQIADILKEVTATPDSVAGQAASKYGAIRGGVKYFKSMNFKVDKGGNRLIVSSTDKVDWKLLKKTIKDLDKPQPQVAIESMIVTIDVTDTKGIGGALRNKKHGTLGINIDAQSAGPADSPQLEYNPPANPISLLGNMINQITPQLGLSTLTFGATKNIWGYLQALKSLSNATVLSQPFMTIANKTAANVVFGSEYRIEQETEGSGGLTGYEPIDANTDLTITPQINLDGLVSMDIDLKIADFINPTQGSQTKRNLKTSVAVANGQVLVLGGFVSTNVTESISKTPILGDIPLLGWFFKWQQRKVIKQYIFIFLCPTIVKPRQIPGMDLYTKMKLHEATDRIEDGMVTKRVPDPVHNWFFNADKENYSHKVIDFANARYQPTTVDIKNDPYYRAQTVRAETEAEKRGNGDDDNEPASQIRDSVAKAVKPEETKSLSASNIQKPGASQPSVSQPAVTPLGPTPGSVQEMPANNQVQTVQTPVIKAQAQNVSPQPVIEQVKREEFKNFISQEPSPAQSTVSVETASVKVVPVATVPAQTVPVQAPQINSQAKLKRDEFKSLLAPEPKVNARRSQDLNFDMIKRNRLKEFLSKNPSLAKSHGAQAANKKENLT